MSKLTVEYCFKNNNADTGYSKGEITYPRNPRKHLAAEVERLLKDAAEKEKIAGNDECGNLILVGFYEFGG